MCGNYIRLKQLMNMIGRQLAVLSPEHSANLMGSACSALILAENPKKLALIYHQHHPLFGCMLVGLSRRGDIHWVVENCSIRESETWNETFFKGIVVYKSQLAFSVILCLPIFAQIKKTSLKFQNSSESTEPIWMDRQMAANIDQRTNDQVEMIWHRGY